MPTGRTILSAFPIVWWMKWQHMTYAVQIHFKEKQVHDAVQRLAKISDTSHNPVFGM
ncbi:MAG: hypothetical protein IPK08_03995 [Bacteroidetes bacterium]|nr:hypothetical protein [Bacteroidota bacterium]